MRVRTKYIFKGTNASDRNTAIEMLRQAGVKMEEIEVETDYVGDINSNIWAEAEVSDEVGRDIIRKGSRFWHEDANGYLPRPPQFFEVE